MFKTEGGRRYYDPDKIDLETLRQKFKDKKRPDGQPVAFYVAFHKMNGYRAKKDLELIPSNRTNRDTGLPPCSQCGGTTFQQTGTCYICQTCFESQGCS